MIKKKLNFIFVILFLFFFTSCQNSENLEEVFFDNNILAKITFYAEEKIINEVYNSKFVEPYIDHSLEKPPITHLYSWLEKNINVFGTENKLVINILDASLKKLTKQNESAKKFEAKDIFYYEIYYSLEFILYDDTNSILSSTIVETERSTTSGQFISLIETDRIIDKLILNALTDATLTSDELIKIHMSKFIF